jgi:hypothetical protein
MITGLQNSNITLKTSSKYHQNIKITLVQQLGNDYVFLNAGWYGGEILGTRKIFYRINVGNFKLNQLR